MPTVPRYDRQVREAGLPDVRLEVHPPEEGIGPLLPIVAAGHLTDAVVDAQREADKVREQQSRIALNQWELDNVYDPEKGAAGKVGEQAFNIVPELKDSLGQFAEEHKKTLSSSKQKRDFDLMVQERWGHVAEWADNHVMRQRQAVKDSTFKANLESSKDRAAADPTTVGVELENMKMAILDQYGGKLSTEAINEELKNQETDLHKRVIDNYIRGGSDDVALAYYDANEKRIDPSERAEIKTKITEASKRLKKERQDKLELDALNVIERTKDFSSLPKTVVEALPISVRSAYRNYAEKLSRGQPVETSPETYYMLTNMTNAELVDYNLMGLKDKLSNSDFQRWADFQRNLKNGKGAAGLDDFRTETQVVNDTLTSAGIDPTPKSTDNWKKIGDFHMRVAQEVRAYQNQTKKKATNEDVERIARGLLTKLSIKRDWWFDREKRAFEVRPEDRVNYATKVGDVPAEDMRQIEDALRRNNVPLSDEAVLNAYNTKIKRILNGR